VILHVPLIFCGYWNNEGRERERVRGLACSTKGLEEKCKTVV
jgi:hypothetical protein